MPPEFRDDLSDHPGAPRESGVAWAIAAVLLALPWAIVFLVGLLVAGLVLR